MAWMSVKLRKIVLQLSNAHLIKFAATLAVAISAQKLSAVRHQQQDICF